MFTPNDMSILGSPAGNSGEPTEPETDETASLKDMADMFGVGVRAGLITPTRDDELYFRTAAMLPNLSAEGQGAWTKDGGVRRPITLVGPGINAPGLDPMEQ
jgi:hypothetical protein